MLVFVNGTRVSSTNNNNEIKINGICFRKTLGDLAVKRTEINHKQRARQDQIPAYFTRL